MSKRVASWRTRMLSIGGREAIIKVIIQTIPLYAMPCFLLPSSLCKELEVVIARFWWQKKAGKTKQWWRLIENPTSLTTRIIRAKYCHDSNFMEVQTHLSFGRVFGILKLYWNLGFDEGLDRDNLSQFGRNISYRGIIK
ncbi:RNA-directed DNA polymerase-like protein [Gossypium australe]|uniref:RNA-directed DNA polymerase-like protein n=1 Tax=Gossypium australe TaxID=47621 RepID=A0A5B6WDM3_9ROSI|nr:RNA-directed DNA polymerase-like protein [Gossypium australe]